MFSAVYTAILINPLLLKISLRNADIALITDILFNFEFTQLDFLLSCRIKHCTKFWKNNFAIMHAGVVENIYKKFPHLFYYSLYIFLSLV